MTDTPAPERRRRFSDPAVLASLINAVLLGLFIVAATAGGFVLSPAAGFFALAGACLVAVFVLMIP